MLLRRMHFADCFCRVCTGKGFFEFAPQGATYNPVIGMYIIYAMRGTEDHASQMSWVINQSSIPSIGESKTRFKQYFCFTVYRVGGNKHAKARGPSSLHIKPTSGFTGSARPPL